MEIIPAAASPHPSWCSPICSHSSSSSSSVRLRGHSSSSSRSEPTQGASWFQSHAEWDGQTLAAACFCGPFLFKLFGRVVPRPSACVPRYARARGRSGKPKGKGQKVSTKKWKGRRDDYLENLSTEDALSKVNKVLPWKNEEELESLLEQMEDPPLPVRVPALNWDRESNDPEDYELKAEMLHPNIMKRPGRIWDPTSDDPLTSGIDRMTRKDINWLRMLRCRGCGIPLQMHTKGRAGYVPLADYLRLKALKLQHQLLCDRCTALERGEVRPVVKEILGQRKPRRSASNTVIIEGFEPEDEEVAGIEEIEDQERTPDGVVPAEVLTKQLRLIRERKCLVVYVVDICDFNGSFVRRMRELIGKNPVLIVATKFDLLPAHTREDDIYQWLEASVRGLGVKPLGILITSSLTGRGIRKATGRIVQERGQQDVVVLGAANAGKSMFITRLLEALRDHPIDNKIQRCVPPVISSTPGTTLALIPLRAFRCGAKSTVWAHLFDTPGVHLPSSMQNLVPIEEYMKVQPIRRLEVQKRNPANDIKGWMREQGIALTIPALTERLQKPLFYTWGSPGELPVAGMEVCPPVVAAMTLDFVAVEGLEVRMVDELPEHLRLARLASVSCPDVLTVDGEVMCDLAITGFGWIAVGFKAMSDAAHGYKPNLSAALLRVYGPLGVRVRQVPYPVPVEGLSGLVKLENDMEREEEEDPEDGTGAWTNREAEAADTVLPAQQALQAWQSFRSKVSVGIGSDRPVGEDMLDDA